MRNISVNLNLKTTMRKVFFVAIVFASLSLGSCSLNKMAQLAEQQSLTVNPSPLELHGDSVNFEMAVNLPVKMLKPAIILTANEVLFSMLLMVATTRDKSRTDILANF